MSAFQKLIVLLSSMGIALFAQTKLVSADLVTLETGGGIYEAASILGTATEGDDMAGLSVNVTFDDATSETVIWVATGSGTGAASGTNWSLNQGPGSTWSNAFTFTNRTGKTVASLTLHGLGSNTIFDRAFGGTGTTGSANGKDIAETLTTVSATQDVIATYHNPVALVGSPVVGDLFAGLKFDFTLGLGNNSSFAFITDTDNTTSNVTLRAIPEPSGFLVFCCILAGCLKRRRSN